MSRLKVPCRAQPFTVFAGDIAKTDLTPLGINLRDFVFPTMTPMLTANPRRVALFFKVNFTGVCITTRFNGQGVRPQDCYTTSNLVTNAVVRVGDPEGYIIDQWFVAWAGFGVPFDSSVFVSGVEIIAQ